MCFVFSTSSVLPYKLLSNQLIGIHCIFTHVPCRHIKEIIVLSYMYVYTSLIIWLLLLHLKMFVHKSHNMTWKCVHFRSYNCTQLVLTDLGNICPYILQSSIFGTTSTYCVIQNSSTAWFFLLWKFVSILSLWGISLYFEAWLCLQMYVYIWTYVIQE